MPEHENKIHELDMHIYTKRTELDRHSWAGSQSGSECAEAEVERILQVLHSACISAPFRSLNDQQFSHVFATCPVSA